MNENTDKHPSLEETNVTIANCKIGIDGGGFHNERIHAVLLQKGKRFEFKRILNKDELGRRRIMHITVSHIYKNGDYGYIAVLSDNKRLFIDLEVHPDKLKEDMPSRILRKPIEEIRRKSEKNLRSKERDPMNKQADI